MGTSETMTTFVWLNSLKMAEMALYTPLEILIVVDERARSLSRLTRISNSTN